MSDATINERLQACLLRLKAGDATVQEELWDLVNDRLSVLTRRMKRTNFKRVGGWAETEDIAQNARLRMIRALNDAVPATVRDFYGLANLQIRRELLDTIRKNQGRNGERDAPFQLMEGIDKANDTYNPEELAVWEEFHKAVGSLPEVERESFELWWYQELSHDEAAEILGVDPSTVKRRCRAARRKLGRLLPQADQVEPE